jgi:hypothetical protein
MSRSMDHIVGRERSWYAGAGRPSLFLAGLWWGAALGFLVGAVVLLCGHRDSPAEHAFDRWSADQMRPAAWRKCHDEQPLPDGMVRCEVWFAAVGRGLIYCPGERSAEQNCRWL